MPPDRIYLSSKFLPALKIAGEEFGVREPSVLILRMCNEWAELRRNRRAVAEPGYSPQSHQADLTEILSELSKIGDSYFKDKLRISTLEANIAELVSQFKRLLEVFGQE